jgi:copper resistance protein B
MNRLAHFLIAIALTMSAPFASAAEDHSHHQHQAPQTDEHAENQPQTDEHAEHQQHAPASSETDEHAHHQQPTDEHDAQSQVDEHAHHRPQASDEPTESERAHVPPPPPQHFMGDMSKERMIELMQMEDDASFGMLLLDQLERRELDGEDAQVWEFDAWYGDDYNKLWFETEGERVDGEEEGRVELMWDRIISPWWSVQTGVRQDFGEGPSRTWLDLGIQGLAPYFFEVDAAIYIGEQGRTAARFSGEYDMLITQQLILQPELEVRLYGKDDRENGIGSGLSDVELGIRLRYEIRRELAPYVGVHWQRKFGETADLARDEGHDVSDVMFLAGVRVWF